MENSTAMCVINNEKMAYLYPFKSKLGFTFHGEFKLSTNMELFNILFLNPLIKAKTFGYRY